MGGDVSYIPLTTICPLLEFSVTLRPISYMKNLLNGILRRLWANDKAILLYTHLLHDNSYDFFLVFSLPGGRKHRKPYASSASYPSNRAGGAGWAHPCFSSLLTRRRGQGAGDNPYTWQIIPIYVLRSMSPGIYIPILVLTHTYI